VEGFSLSQIALKTGVSRKKVTRLLGQADRKTRQRNGMVVSYEGLIRQWYGEYPFLQAIQVLQRLRSYGYQGGYTAVKEFTLPFRKKRKKEAFHEVTVFPGQEAQVDWMQRSFPFGTAYGFVYILSYSRYVYLKFYPASTMEFFLDGHVEALREVGGVAATHTYDNLKSVILGRKPEFTYNPRFLDLARHFHFSIRVCTPRRANEKGRVERVIRDVESFLRVNTFADLMDLNRKTGAWRSDRNNRIHRTIQRTPAEALKEEKLKPLPQIPYKPYRHETAAISATGFVTVQSNRYSVPSSFSGMTADLFIYPERIEVVVKDKTVATHKRLFGKHEKTELPGHREKLLAMSPHFKLQRIHQLMTHMDKSLEHFLTEARKQGQDPLSVSYELFKLLRGISRETLLSAVRQANDINSCRVAYIQGLLSPSGYQNNPVHPQDAGLLHIKYDGRALDEYDGLL
jgi:transposase